MKKRTVTSTILAFCLSLVFVFCGVFGGCAKTPTVTDDENAKVTKLVIDATKAKVEFNYGEDFSTEGLVIKAMLDNGSTKEIDAKDCTIKAPNMFKSGKRSVAVSYAGRISRYQIKIGNRVLPNITSSFAFNVNAAKNEYKVEAEDIDTSIFTTLKMQEGKNSFVVDAPIDDETTSGKKYLGNFGVLGNYVAFRFNSDKEYNGAVLSIALAYSGETDPLSLSKNFALYLNPEVNGTKTVGKIDLTGLALKPAARNWREFSFRSLQLKKGENIIGFEALTNDVPDVDYVTLFVAGKETKSKVEITSQSYYKIEMEDTDIERITTEGGHGVDKNEPFYEKPNHESPDGDTGEVKKTSGGQCLGGVESESEFTTTIVLGEDSTVNIQLRSSALKDYYVSDNWNFLIDGYELKKVENKNIKGGRPGSPYWEYWDWMITSLGTYNLSAGKHVIILQKQRGSATNLDYLGFDVKSYGSYADEGVDLDSQDADLVIKDYGTFKVEAEDLDKTGWVPEAQYGLVEHWKNDMGEGDCAKGLGKGTVVTVKLTVKKDCKLKMIMRTAMHYTDILENEIVSFYLDDLKLTPSTGGFPFGKRNANDYWYWGDLQLGTVDVKAGEHELKVSIYSVNIDYFTFEAIEK